MLHLATATLNHRYAGPFELSVPPSLAVATLLDMARQGELSRLRRQIEPLLVYKVLLSRARGYSKNNQ